MSLTTVRNGGPNVADTARIAAESTVLMMIETRRPSAMRRKFSPSRAVMPAMSRCRLARAMSYFVYCLAISSS